MPQDAKSDDDLMREAFQALLRGDTKTRDDICDRLMKRHEARERESLKIAQAAAPFFQKH